MIASLGLIVACLTIHALASGAQISLLSANRPKLEADATRGVRAARFTLEVLEHEDRVLATCLVTASVSLVIGTALSTALALGDSIPVWPVVAGYGLCAIVFSEALPRVVFRRHATSLAPFSAQFVNAGSVGLLPVLLLLRAWAWILVRMTGSAQRTPVSRQDLLLLLKDAPDQGELGSEERRMIQRVFAISERAVKECMTPLVEVDAVSAESLVRDAIAVAVRNGHSRLPVYDGRIDHIVGIIEARDLLFGAQDEAPVSQVMHTARHVPETKRVDELLQEMRREREPMAVVVDEYGGSVGIITVEDLLEEIIGEIRDEREVDALGIRKLSETEWRVPARVAVRALEKALSVRLPDGEYETVGGLLLATTGRIPLQGEIVQIGGITFRIEQSNERALQTVLVSLQE